jgi:UDP-N-acetyl-D-galactosamine dehydrogenase
VDPYYLTHKAESVGYHPQVILAGRRINNGMGKFVAEQTMKRLSQLGRPVNQLKVIVLGLTFKENVPDLRNSKVPDIIKELQEYGVEVLVHDPLAESEEAVAEYNLHLSDWNTLKNADGIVLAVAHRTYIEMGQQKIVDLLRKEHQGVVIDVKSVLDSSKMPKTVEYWRL